MTSPRTRKRGSAPERRRPVGRPSREARHAFVINVVVGDVMSRNPSTIGPGATLLDALVLMRSQKVSGLPVVDEAGDLTGVLSQRDIARALRDAAGVPEMSGPFDLLMASLSDRPGTSLQALRQVLEETTVRDAMSSPAITIAPAAALELAADMMRENEINRIPVVRAGRLIGIVTRHDIVRALVHP